MANESYGGDACCIKKELDLDLIGGGNLEKGSETAAELRSTGSSTIDLSCFLLGARRMEWF